ncbi:unnamed protein product [Rotaria sp. Silwood2]|nr:unnamed protein product [Rotaria sp. Silwood2]CAF4492014.1 unnamed protein product [Rotaria sp. Silwood2]CAF4547922.1 unnamed protein product [Rotaria sp. Silwood2]
MQNIDVIFKYRFFITDLCTQLKQLYNENISSLEETLIVYRGQTIGCDELEKIQQNINGLISMNTYLSTTRKKDLALMYAGNGSDRPLFESVLFEITIKKSISTKTKPFADITYMSSFGMGEEEILLSLGSIFKIQSVEQLVENGIVWQVKLILNEAVVNKEIDMLFNYLKTNSTTSISNIGTLGLLLGQMGDYVKAERYYQMMLNELPKGHCGRPIILNNMGILYSDMGDNKKALKYYRKSYETYKMQKVSENDLLFANLYHNMGSLYYENDDNKTALEYFTKAFEICHNNLTLPSLLLCATLHTDMGEIFDDNGDFDKALDELQCTLEIQLRILPSNHFRIAATYNNIGGFYLGKGDYKTALQNFEKALDIGSKSLPNTHENIQTYSEHIKITEKRISQIKLIPNQHYTIKELLGEEIQYLIKNKDNQSEITDYYRIPIDDLLKGTTAVGLYFCPCSIVLTHLQSNQHLIEVYREILTNEGEKKIPFEIIFMSYQEDEEEFKNVFKIMPWTAVEYKTDKQREWKKAIEEYLGTYLFIKAKPILFILKTLTGEVLSKNGIEVINSMKLNAIEIWCNGNRVFHPSTATEEKNFIWKYVQCDGCKRAPLVGLRYKCQECPDYDLCETCKEVTDHKHHEFILISKPEEYY